MLLDRFASDRDRPRRERLHLEVREGNHALSLYERAGFALVGRRRNYYSGRDGQTYDALTLAKNAHRLDCVRLRFGLVRSAETDLSPTTDSQANDSHTPLI